MVHETSYALHTPTTHADTQHGRCDGVRRDRYNFTKVLSAAAIRTEYLFSRQRGITGPLTANPGRSPSQAQRPGFLLTLLWGRTYVRAMKRPVPSKRFTVTRWRVNVIAGARARDICQIEAKSAEEAVKRAIKEYGISDQNQQQRLGAYRILIVN